MSKDKDTPGGMVEQIAAKHGVSMGEVVREMQAAIDAAWNATDPAARARQRELFPHGKPSIEEFIRVMAAQVDD